MDADRQPYSLDPRALLVGGAEASAEREVVAAGYQVGWRCDFSEAERQAVERPHELIVATLTGAGPDELEVCAALAEQDRPLAIRCPPEALAPVADRLGGGPALLLCDPAPGELSGELALLRAGRGMRLHDSAGQQEAVRLQLLADQVSRIARTLAEMTDSAPGLGRRGGLRSPTDDFHPAPRAIASEAPVTARAVRAVISERRLRDRFLDPDLFGEPAWDMLLDLYAARLEHARVSVSSLCIAAAVPSTTALRWLRTLTDCGLVERRADPHDKRRVFIELGDGAATGMNGYFAALAAA